MKSKLLFFILLLLPIVVGCIDKNYDLDELEIKGTILTNLEIPVGNFKEVRLSDMDIDLGTELMDEYGRYHIDLSTDIHGLDFDYGDDLSFEEAELHMVILNTIPLDMDLSVYPIDAEGVPVRDVRITVEAGQKPAISAGSVGAPSTNNIVLRVTCEGSLHMEGIHVLFKGNTGAGHEWETLKGDQGFKMNNVYLKIPKGLKLS